MIFSNMKGANSFRIVLARAAVHLQRARIGSTSSHPAGATLGSELHAAKYYAADATKMTAEEVERLQHVAAAPMSQRPLLLRTSKHDSGDDNIHHAPWVEPAIYPLLAMISLAFGLGIMTMYRELVDSPTVLIDKRKRVGLVEMEDPEWTSKKGEQFATTSPLKHMSMNRNIVAEKTSIGTSSNSAGPLGGGL